MLKILGGASLAALLSLGLVFGMLSTPHSGARPAAAATPGAGPEVAVLQDFITAVNVYDGPTAAGYFTDDGWLQQINGGSFGIFGRAALTFVFGDGSTHTHVTLIGTSVSGNTVTGTIEYVDDDVSAAGVQRVIQPFTVVMMNGKIQSLDLRYDRTDAQTATYLDYSAANSSDDDDGEAPPDATQISMGGNQKGTAFLGTAETGSFFVAIEIDPGPAGALQPSNIYTGTCSSLGSVYSKLALVQAGSSGNLVSGTLQNLIDGDYAVTVSASDAEPNVIVSCANIEHVAVTGTQLPSTGSATPAGTGLTYVLLAIGLAALGATGLGGSLALRRRG